MWKKWFALTLKILVSGFLIWFLLNNVDLEAAKARVLKVAPEMLAFGFAAVAVQLFIANVRWRVVLNAVLVSTLPFLQTLRILYIGFFFNQALPSSVGGDAVRMVLAHRAGLPLGQAISGVFLERVANVLALVLIVTMATPFFVSHVEASQRPWIWTAVIVLLFVALGGLAFLIALRGLPRSFHRWRIVRGLVGLADDARRVFLSPYHAVQALGWSIAGFLNVCLIVYLLAIGLNLNVTFVDCLVLIPPVLLVTIIPISIAGWGVREGAMVGAFALIGVPSEGALVLSILFGLLSLIIFLPGGLVWMITSEKKQEIFAAASALDANDVNQDEPQSKASSEG